MSTEVVEKKASEEIPEIGTAEYAELEHAWAIRVREFEGKVCEAEAAYVEAKAEAIVLKKDWEAKCAQLRRMVRRGPSPEQQELPFDEPDQDGKEPPPADWDARLEVAIEKAITMTKKQQERLDELGVKTVGDFERLRGGQDRDHPRGLVDVKGVGEATISKWEDEIVEFLRGADDATDD